MPTSDSMTGTTNYRSLDGLSRPGSNIPQPRVMAPEVRPPAVKISPVNPPKLKQQSKRDYKNIKIASAVFGLLVAMFLDPTLLEQPHLIAGVYFLLVIALGIDSQNTFLLALMFLISVPVMLTFDREFVAEQFATLSYFLLVLGVGTAAWEMRMNKPATAIGYRQ